MFMVGVIPALLVFYIRRTVPESPGWSRQAAVERGSTWTVVKSHWQLGIYAVVLMTAFNFFSHGTQTSIRPSCRSSTSSRRTRSASSR